MQIPPYPLPSDLKTIIYFRVPNVEDALLFSEIHESQEEQNTTQYLNHMQDLAKQNGKLNDAALWTGESRRTALWWIFIASQELPSISVSYDCKYCNEPHFLDLSLPSLTKTATVLDKPPVAKIEGHFNGRKMKNLEVRSLNGQACESVEMMRNRRDQYQKNSIDWKKANKEMALTELAHHLTFSEQPEEFNEALDWKIDQIKLMAIDTEFRALSAKVEMELRAMRHGLLTKYKDGRYMLVADHRNCPKAIQAGEEPSKILLLPFRGIDFIPAL